MPEDHDDPRSRAALSTNIDPPATWFEQAVATSNEAMWTVALDGRILYANQALLGYLQRPRAELHGTNNFDLMHPGDVERARAGFAVVPQMSLLGITGVYRFCLPDGSWLSLEVGATLVDHPTEPGAQAVQLVGRSNPIRNGFATVLTSMAAADPLDIVLAHLASALDRPEWFRRTAIAFDDDDGNRAVAGELPGLLAIPELSESCATHRHPVSEALATGEPVVCSLEAGHPPDVVAAAAAVDSTTCVAIAVRDPGGGRDVCIVDWLRGPGAAALTRMMLRGDPDKYLRLALEQRASRRRLEREARVDGLTGLHNRRHFVATLDQALEEGTAEVTVFYLDLDRFKPVNDTHGHLVGDQVLTEVARRLEASVRPADAVARLGGDEFAVMCVGLNHRSDVEHLAERIGTAISAPIHVAGHSIQVGVSVGVNVGRRRPDADAAQIGSLTAGERLLITADHALYDVKRAGGGGHRLVG